MKSLKTFTTLVALMVVAILWTACKKEQSLSTSQQPENNQAINPHYGGLVQDDPLVVSKVPFIISSNLLEHGSTTTTVNASTETLSAAAKGGRPKPSPGFDGTHPPVTLPSPLQRKPVHPPTMALY